MSSSNDHQSSSELAAGTILQDRYRIARPLGKGGMGAVYEALDLRLDTTVALKETFSTDEHLRKQFEREARMLAHLNHPSLPRVTDYFNDGDRAFLVMEFIEGVDLAKIIVQQPGPFPLESVVAWADQLLDALIYLHTRDRQVIHRDIKPHNLKLTPEGQIALLDFGLAKAQQSHPTGVSSSAAVFGYTKQYAPLEQIQDLATGPQSDIYALGATLYHLLTGIKPPDALTRAAALVQSRPDPLRPADEVHWAIGPEIAAILKRAMAQSAEDRYQSARDFRDALRRVGRRSIVAPCLPAGRDTTVAAPVCAEATTTVVLSHGRQQKAEPPAFLHPGNFNRGYAQPALAIALILLLAGLAAFLLRPESISYPAAAAKALTSNSDPAAAGAHAGKSLKPGSHKSEGEVDNGLLAATGRPTNKTANESLPPTSPASPAIDDASSQVKDNAAEQSSSSQGRRGASPTPKAPKINLLNPDLSRSYQPPVAALLPINGPQSPADANTTEAPRVPASSEIREPQVLRARDGTQIVKLPDGSTRVYRPGERNVRSAELPQ